MAEKWYRKSGVQAALVAGFFVIIAAVIGILPHIGNDSSKENISVNYARIFGAFQAPFVFTGSKVYGCSELRIDFLLGNKEVQDFWKTWKYRNALPIKSRVWDELFDCNKRSSSVAQMRRAEMLLKIGCENMPVTSDFFKFLADKERNSKIAKYLRKNSPDELDSMGFFMKNDFKHYLLAIGNKIQSDEILTKVAEGGRNIGFLVLYLQNISEKMMKDLKLFYKEFERLGFSPPFTSSEAVEKKFDNAKGEARLIPQLDTGETLLLLLAIYKKDENGYPSKYISSVIRPIKIEYRFSGNRSEYEQMLRLPLKEQSLKINLPFGWYGQ